MSLGQNHKETAKALAESEKLYRLLAEHSTDMISKHTPEGVYTYASPACRALLGYEPEELVGRDAYELFHPDDFEEIRKTHTAILERPDTYTVAYRIRRKDGSYTWFETTSRTVRDPDTGEVLEIITVSRDITGRKRTEEALRESQEALRRSEEFHRLAAEAGRIGTWDLDLQTEECVVSRKMAELMGFPLDQTTVPGAQWWESIVPDDRTSMASALAASIEGEAPFDLEFRIALKDGTERWLYSRGAVTRNASGNALRMHGVSIDVTERKRVEAKLRESEERLRRAIGIETVGVIFFKADGSITDSNDAFLRMSGYPRADLEQGKLRWDVMTPPEWMPHSLKAIEEFESTGRISPYEKEYVRKDGSRWWALFAATRLDEEEGVEFIIDITERKQAEQALRESNKRIMNILESITDAFFAVDSQWRFTYLNQQAERILQRRREELLGKNLWEEFPEAVGSTFYERYHEATKSGTSVHFEEFYEPLSYWAEVHAYPSGEGLAVYFRDVTERKQAREALQRSEERFRLLAEKARDVIYRYRLAPTPGFEYVSPSVTEVLGHTPEEHYANPDLGFEVVHPDDRHLLEQGLENLAASEEPTLLRWRRKDGRLIWTEQSNTLIHDASGKPVAIEGIARDITERKRAEETLWEIREAERRRIARDLHDEVLQDLVGALQALQALQIESHPTGSEIRLSPELDALRRAVRGLRGAIHDLRQEKGQPFVGAVEALVELNRQTRPESQIRFSVQQGFPHEIPGKEGTELLRIVREALVNARRHSGARRVDVVLLCDGDEVCVAVSDDGRGFDPRTTGGGLGLSGMRERAHALGWELAVRSDVGKGTRVAVKARLHDLLDGPRSTRSLPLPGK